MISVTEALQIIQAQAMSFGEEEIPLTQGMNRVLQEDWYTDRPLPPYDRVTMDGIAINYTAFEKGQREFLVEGIAAAGMPQLQLKNPTACLEVMTGSILPLGCDTVIRYEDIAVHNDIARIEIEGINHQQNVHFKGEDRQKGELVVPKNTRISAAEIGVGSSIGKAMIKVAKLPRVMVISTGDELVKIAETPLPHQIRRSNVYRLVTTLKQMGIQADSDHINDNVEEIEVKIKQYLQEYDVLMLSGGVSKGKFDYIPQVMEQLGVEKLFHKIKQRPGKPFWFGKYKNQCTIFALPGNPNSSFLCMHRYFIPWLAYTQNGAFPSFKYAELTEDVYFKPELTYFLQVQVASNTSGKLLATPQKSNGSGDFANLVRADAFIQLPSDRNDFYKGEVYPIFGYR